MTKLTRRTALALLGTGGYLGLGYILRSMIDLIEHGQHPSPPEPRHLRPWTNRERPAKTAEASAVSLRATARVPTRQALRSAMAATNVSTPTSRGFADEIAMHALAKLCCPGRTCPGAQVPCDRPGS